MASGTLALIRDETLREAIAGWPGRTDDIRERASVLVSQEAYVYEGLDRVAGELGLGLLTRSNAATLLRAVRLDDQAMARVARKHFHSRIYLDELGVSCLQPLRGNSSLDRRGRRHHLARSG